ncbi:hypothetical protein ASD02_34820 [Ensifer sp. Root1252]|nr:hypothetical protein ASD02_34820 [Ensifer sp. Root1252]KQY69506.1 hypothetical protein ASD52_32255 [Ensifer sp. Root142]KRC69394.1 hypothetical protein ASE32_34645 [Ensifer sp. Root231]KRC96670.1 hypothetical protein ASE47_30910 [Ensifer sp. Root258]
MFDPDGSVSNFLGNNRVSFSLACETASLTAEPNPTLLPTVNVAAASHWGKGEKPTAASGLSVGALRSLSIGEEPYW